MRKHQQRLPLLLAAVFSAATQANEPSPSPGLDVLENFVGRWQGTATAYFPRQPERESRHEQVQASCEKALEGTYVECRSIWTDTNGATRELRMFWNFHAREDRFEILYLYDNWPGKVQYKLEYNADTRTLTGRDSFQGPGGVEAEEIVSWTFAEDGQAITSTEQNHYVSDPEGQWHVSFEFQWQRHE